MAEGFDDIDMTEMGRRYPEYDDMTYEDLNLEREKLENEDNLLDETIDETVELDKRREYVKYLLDTKFSNEVTETSFPTLPYDRIDPRKPDERQEFIVSEFIKDEYKTHVDFDKLMGIRKNYEFVK